MAKQPKKSYKMGDIEIALWEEVINTKEGNDAFKKQNLGISRNYKDKEGNWQSSKYLPVESIPTLKAILTKIELDQKIVREITQEG